MKMRIVLLLPALGAALACGSCSSDSITDVSSAELVVTVLDEMSEPIDGAEVAVYNDEEHRATTAADGRCRMSGLVAVTTVVRVRMDDYRWIYDTIALRPGSQAVSYALEPFEAFADDFESGSFSSSWTLSGDGDWSITTGEAHGGLRSARSALIDNNEECSLATALEVRADVMTLRFWYKLDTSSYDHYFEFYVDGERILRMSGSVDWTEYEIVLTEGIHEIIWRLHNDYYGSAGSTVWLDDVVLEQ